MKKYVIRKGKHNVKRFPKILWNIRAINLCFRFDSSAIYKTQNPLNQNDWNKLFGFSRGYHHHNSIRLAWRWNPKIEKIELAKYMYKKGSRSYEIIGATDINQSKTVKLEFNEGIPLCYLLYPFFGGDETAPHDIRIEIGYGFN